MYRYMFKRKETVRVSEKRVHISGDHPYSFKKGTGAKLIMSKLIISKLIRFKIDNFKIDKVQN